VLPAGASVLVAELNPVVLEWCKGPLAIANKDAVEDHASPSSSGTSPL